MKINELLSETFLIELPHIKVGDRAVDLELEVHSSMDPYDYLDYIEDWIYSRPIPSKTRGLVMRVDPEEVEDFVKKLLQHELFEKFTRKYYGPPMWEKVRTMLLARLEELRQF